MHWILSLLYGVVSGISSFLPLSSSAHQGIVLYLFGMEQRIPIWDLMVHIALLVSLIFACKPLLLQLQREMNIAAQSRSNRIRRTELRGLHMIRLVRTAMVPLCVGLLLRFATVSVEKNMLILAFFLLLNGLILFISERVVQGNKHASAMTKSDGYLIGICGALSVIPGISMIGCATTVSVIRGADKQQALNWSLLLCIPMLIVLIIIDFVSIFIIGVAGFTFSLFIAGILCAGIAFSFGYVSVMLLRLLMTKVGLSGFAYYSWGACLLAFILYLWV